MLALIERSLRSYHGIFMWFIRVVQPPLEDLCLRHRDGPREV
jgi:hypothetical protein